MRKLFFGLFVSLACQVFGQSDSTFFRAYLYNSEFQIGMRINFYDQDIVVPDQELFGQMAGYLKKDGTSYCWLVVTAQMKGKRARLQMSNDYGSEDLEAELTCHNDSTYTLKQLSGSALKVPNHGKWLKLPRELVLKRR
jgi:hypothetical protein